MPLYHLVQLRGDSFVLQEFVKTNQLLANLMEGVQSIICRVTALEDNVGSSSTSSRAPQTQKTPWIKDVPLAVRVSTLLQSMGTCDWLVTSEKNSQ